MPKRPKSGSGHHRLEICGPSNGRHKIAQDRPDFFAMLRSLPSAIDDALDTLYEPNAAFSQFLRGSASMIFFFFSFPCFLFLSCLFFLVLSFLSFLVFSLLSFPLSFFRFLVFSFFSIIFFSFLCFFFPIDLRLSCVCVVIGTTCNIHVVVFVGWHAV